jgi:hypothetical protein
MTRPSAEKIRKAFDEHLTVSVKGFEETVWDLLNWGGVDLVIDFLQEYALPKGESVGVNADYQHMNLARLEESIKEY